MLHRITEVFRRLSLVFAGMFAAAGPDMIKLKCLVVPLMISTITVLLLLRS
jgi:hypothetical protein